MAGGSLRDKVNADKAALANLRKGLDTTVLPVVRPPSDAGMVEGLRPTPAPAAREEPARTPEPAVAPRVDEPPPRWEWPPAPPAASPPRVPDPTPAPAVAPVEPDLDSRSTSVFSAAPSSRSVIVEGSALDAPRPPFTPDPTPAPVAPAEVNEPKPAAREEPTIAGPRGFSQRRRSRVEAPVRAPEPAPVAHTEALAEVSEPKPAARVPAPVEPPPEQLSRFGMDDAHAPPGHAEPGWVSEPPTMVSVPSEISSRTIGPLSFGLPGTSRKVVDSCMLQYVGSKGDEYTFVLTNTLGGKTRKENITLRVGDASFNMDVKTKSGGAVLGFSLQSVHKNKKVGITLTAHTKALTALVESAKDYKLAEAWANTRIKPYIPEIALAVVFAAVDLVLTVTGLGSNLLGAFQPVAVAALAFVQTALVGWSYVHRHNNLNAEAAALEVKADTPRSA